MLLLLQPISHYDLKPQLAQGFWAHGNFLASLPSDFGKLVNLHTISLAGNKLTNLPKSLSGLVRLRDLGLQGNELSEVPAEMGGLSESHTLMCVIISAMTYAKLTSSCNILRHVMCCAVLRYPELCCARCALLCCAVLCCAVLCCAVLCCAVLCCAVLCCAVLCCVLCRAVSDHAVERKRIRDIAAGCHSRSLFTHKQHKVAG